MDFSFDNITHYLHPKLLRNLCGYTETNGTYIIKKYHGCKKRTRNGMRRVIMLEETNVQKQQIIHTGENQKIYADIKVRFT